MKIVFAGTPDVAVPSLEALIAAGHDLVAVITRPDAPAGRGRKLQPSPVAQWAQSHNIETLKPQSAKDPNTVLRLKELAPDCCPVVAYGNLITRELLAIPQHGWVNLHFSKLPAWRGAAPIQRAIINGDPTWAATTFELVPALDAGPTYRNCEILADPHGTSGEALQQLSELGADLLVQTLADIAVGISPTQQPEVGITLAPKLTVEEAHIVWTDSAIKLDRLIRGCNPAPGAWTSFRGERFKILTCEVVSEENTPGEIIATKRDVVIGTGSQSLRLGYVQPVGKKPMAAADWARGVTFNNKETLV
ncbi:MAG: methionyl-tRNA formyltransferase [Propionibacteriaceae bacterium]